MSRLDRAVARALSTSKRVAGRAVTYRRGALTVELTAIRGTSPTTIESADGQRVRVFARDYLIDAADLDFGDGLGPVEPAIGDRLEEDGATYELTSLGDGDTPWRWHDAARTRYRIHTVES